MLYVRWIMGDFVCTPQKWSYKLQNHALAQTDRAQMHNAALRHKGNIFISSKSKHMCKSKHK